MSFNLRNFVVHIVLVNILSFENYAPDIEKNCESWLELTQTNYYKIVLPSHIIKQNQLDFDMYATEQNRKSAASRDRSMDIDVPVFAVLYAQLLGSFRANDAYFTSTNFCSLIYGKNHQNVLLVSSSLRRLDYPCSAWINFYGFDSDLYSNRTRSINRGRYEDDYMHIFVVMYARFLSDVPKEQDINSDVYSVTEFCKGIVHYDDDNNVGNHPFMSFERTELTCEGWLEFAGFYFQYSGDHYINIKKRQNNTLYHKYLNTWAKLYVRHLLSNDVKMTPKQFCAHNKAKNISYPYYIL